ncbi:MAG TPA: AEC family transporter [Rubrobacteraceae bacterium]|nr:AEC family transporter [Rubrobacteraceae bacterium]
MVLAVFAKVLLPILVVVGLGYLLRRRFDLDVQSINRVSIYLLSPALIFTSLTRVRLAADETLRITAFMVLFVLVMGVLTWTMSRTLRLDAMTTSALLLCVMFMNAGNYGLPLAQFAFGEEGLRRAVLFFVVQAVLAQTVAVYIAGAGHGDWLDGFKRLFRMPQVYAVLAALAVRWTGIQLDASSGGILNDLFRGVALMGDATVPVLLIVLGLQLAESNKTTQRREIALATVMRLVVSIPLALALAYLLQMDGLSTKLAVILASMPTAVNMMILAIEFDVRPRLVSGVVAVSTFLSLISLTVLLLIFGVS